MEANLIAGPDSRRNSRKTIQTEISLVDPNSSAEKALQTKFDQIESDARLLRDSEKQRCMQIVGSLQYVATVTRI
jgi:hypothetical protein